MSRRGKTGTAVAATRERRGCSEPGVGGRGAWDWGVGGDDCTVQQRGGCRLGLGGEERRKGEKFWYYGRDGDSRTR
jgi:hypothetical protein